MNRINSRNITIGILSIFLIAIFAIGFSSDIVNATELNKLNNSDNSTKLTKIQVPVPPLQINNNTNNSAMYEILNLDTSRKIVEVPWNAMFGYIDTNYHTISGDLEGWQQITSYKFYLPADSYVYVDVNGVISNFEAGAGIILSMDNNDAELGVDWSTYKVYTYYLENSYLTYLNTGFGTSKIYYLKKGYHTVYLFASAGVTYDIDGNSMTWVYPVTFNIIANQKGRTDTS